MAAQPRSPADPLPFIAYRPPRPQPTRARSARASWQEARAFIDRIADPLPGPSEALSLLLQRWGTPEGGEDEEYGPRPVDWTEERFAAAMHARSSDSDRRTTPASGAARTPRGCRKTITGRSPSSAPFDRVLDAYGFVLATEHYDHEHFGDGWAEYSRRGIRLRLVWNGRDGVLPLAFQRRMLSRIPLGSWVDVEASAADPRPFVRDRSPARLDALEAATRQLLETWHTPAYKRQQRKRDSRPPT